MPSIHHRDRRSARLEELADPAEVVDPIGVVPWRPFTTEPHPYEWVVGVLFFLGGIPLLFFVIAPLFIALLELSGPIIGIVAVVLFVTGLLHQRTPQGPLIQALIARDGRCSPTLTHRDTGDDDVEPLKVIELPLRFERDGRVFDPADPTDRAMARVLHRCRALDGAALVNATRICIDLVQLERHPSRTDADRAADWTDLWRWSSRLADPVSAWLAAMALAEDRVWLRAVEALERLEVRGGPPSVSVLRDAMLAHGALPAQVAAAVHGEQPDVLDRLGARIADLPPDHRWMLVQARLRFPAPPIGRWLDEPAWGEALVRLDPGRLGSTDWLRLVDHPDPHVAAAAAERVVDPTDGRTERAARTLLDRDDLMSVGSARFDRAGSTPDGDLVDVIEMMLGRLGHDGTASDLVRIGRWRDVAPVAAAARRALDTLRARLVELPDGGGLAVADAPGGALWVVPQAASVRRP